ncbi:hypothetical protein N0V95_010105, partial [Ascochyta clinopodiicola]
MEYINNSVRKLGNLFFSPPPATVLGKRKAPHDGDVEGNVLESLTFERFNSGEYTVGESSGGSSSRRRRADLLHSHSAIEEDNHYGSPVPRPPQRRVSQPTALISRSEVATQNAERAILRARVSMGKTGTQTLQSDKQQIQDELDQQQLQEVIDRKRLLAHKKKMQAAGNIDGKNLLSDLGPAPSTPTSRSPTWSDLTPNEKWSTEPNRRAREFLEEYGHDTAAMLEDLQEPAYVCRDTEIRDGLRKMINQIEDFAKAYFSFTVNDHSLLRPALESMEKETVSIVGCVASGGPAGASGWEDLFLAPDKRQALVCAIIGNVLVEQVFQHMFFGGTEAQIQDVAAIQYEHCHEDGFDRNALYAAKIRSFLTPTSSKRKVPSLHLPLNFTNHTTHITAALLTHLRPLLALTTTHPNLLPTLHTLVTTTALLSLHMHLDAHTVYHFAPVFKDQPFSATEMVFLNAPALLATHPHSAAAAYLSAAEQIRRDALSNEERQRMQRDEALVQVAVMPGVVAYR